MSGPTVVGCVVARDEWPLLGLSIVHALSFVDRVAVVDHASVDGSRAGLARLAQAYPGRISILRVDSTGFPQEALTCLLMRHADPGDVEWVYVFDADEFLLAGPGSSLADVLAAQPDQVAAVRYDVVNWLAPTSMVDGDLTAYSRIRYRRATDTVMDSSVPDAVERGELNFFQVPFDSKVIVRSTPSVWLQTGAHGLRSPLPIRTQRIGPETLRAGHLPMLSRARLERKGRLGQTHVDRGYPAGFGWQNQVIRRLQLRGELDRFWADHSVPDSAAESDGRADLVSDESLGEVLDAAVTAFSAVIDGSDLGSEMMPDPALDRISLTEAIDVIDSIQRTALLWESQVVQLCQARDEAAGRDAVLTELNQTLTQERAEWAQRASTLQAQLDALTASRSWRVTRPLRALRERRRS